MQSPATTLMIALGERNPYSYLSKTASVVDAERHALALATALKDTEMFLLLTDTQAALRKAINICRGDPPKVGSEIRLKKPLDAGAEKGTGIS